MAFFAGVPRPPVANPQTRPHTVQYPAETGTPSRCLEVSQDTRPRILLIDDDPDVRELLTMALEGEAYAVATAETAEEGLDRLRSGRFQLVLTDYALPRKTGTMLLEEAERAGLLKNTPSLMITAHPDARPYPGTDIVTKPFDLERLLARVRSLAPRTSTPGAKAPQRTAFAKSADMDSRAPASSRRSRAKQKRM